MIVLLLVLKLLVSSHPLNFKGVLAFMCFSFIKVKLNTTLLCFLKKKSEFHCTIMSMFRVLLSQLTMILHFLDQYCAGFMSPQKLLSVITYLLEDEQELSLGMLDTSQTS